jgi:hypothetical protein
LAKELDPKAGLTDEPEGRIEKMLAENVAKSKQRAKIAALTRGVSMASNLLDKPTFAKAAAAAGKEAPLLAKETAAAMKGAETLPLQWEMIKEKIALTGEEAVKKAEVGEKRKADYQTGYLTYLNRALDQASKNPDVTIGELFGKVKEFTPAHQVNALKQISSAKGVTLNIRAIDVTKPENYKNLPLGSIVKDTDLGGDWYVIEEVGVLGNRLSQKEITDSIQAMVKP